MQKDDDLADLPLGGGSPGAGAAEPPPGEKKPLWRRLGGRLAGTLAALVLASVALVVPWRWLAPPATAFMVGARLGLGQPRVAEIHYRWVSWDDVSPHLPIALVASEDQKFPHHDGFDLESIQQALEDERGRRRGASTISQQVAKNLYLWPGRSLLRKGLEAYFTVLIETFWPKRRILEVYWNVAELGPGIYGAGAASEHHFGKPAARLTAREAALLAAVLPAPRRMSPSEPSAYVRERASEIQRQVRNLGGADYLAGL